MYTYVCMLTLGMFVCCFWNNGPWNMLGRGLSCTETSSTMDRTWTKQWTRSSILTGLLLLFGFDRSARRHFDDWICEFGRIRDIKPYRSTQWDLIREMEWNWIVARAKCVYFLLRGRKGDWDVRFISKHYSLLALLLKFIVSLRYVCNGCEFVSGEKLVRSVTVDFAGCGYS